MRCVTTVSLGVKVNGKLLQAGKREVFGKEILYTPSSFLVRVSLVC